MQLLFEIETAPEAFSKVHIVGHHYCSLKTRKKNPYFIFKKMGIKVLSTAKEVLFEF